MSYESFLRKVSVPFVLFISLLKQRSVTNNSVLFFAYIQFVSSPKCQYILNEIVYEDLSWQDRNIFEKMFWAFKQLIFLVVLSLPYVFDKLGRLCFKNTCWGKLLTKKISRSCSCYRPNSVSKVQKFYGFFRNTFEHPYSKLVNHTIFYLAFLGLVIYSTFERNFGTTSSGLSIIGKNKLKNYR